MPEDEDWLNMVMEGEPYKRMCAGEVGVVEQRGSSQSEALSMPRGSNARTWTSDLSRLEMGQDDIPQLFAPAQQKAAAAFCHQSWRRAPMCSWNRNKYLHEIIGQDILCFPKWHLRLRR
jgi:hypothetical protein